MIYTGAVRRLDFGSADYTVAGGATSYTERITGAAPAAIAGQILAEHGTAIRRIFVKVAALMRQLERGEAAIVYDSESQTTSIVPKHSLR